MDVNEIKELIALMRDSGTTRISIREGEFGLELEMGSSKKAPDEQCSISQKPSAPEEKGGTFVISPMVGTFYSSQAPGQPPFVKIGQKINKGDLICIVEAMKVMNEVKSDVSGTVAEILIDDSQPVEFGSKLIRVV